VRAGKGGKDRRTLLPSRVGDQRWRHLEEMRRVHRADLAYGWGRVLLPDALARKVPGASLERSSRPESSKAATCHTFRHSLSTPPMERRQAIGTIQ
jgi:hypothetical protein